MKIQQVDATSQREYNWLSIWDLVIFMSQKSSLPQMTTSSAASDENFVKMAFWFE